MYKENARYVVRSTMTLSVEMRLKIMPTSSYTMKVRAK